MNHQNMLRLRCKASSASRAGDSGPEAVCSSCGIGVFRCAEGVTLQERRSWSRLEVITPGDDIAAVSSSLGNSQSAARRHFH